MAPQDNEFFDAPSPVGDRNTRREAILDYCEYVEDLVASLRDAVSEGFCNLQSAREHFAEIKGWVDAIDDNLCERDQTGARVA